MANSQAKKRAPIFVGRWKQLDTAGDVKRFVRQIILQAYADKMPMKKATGLAHIAAVMLRCIEVADLETELLQIEERRGNHAPLDETRATH